jgi:hypothetical protein
MLAKVIAVALLLVSADAWACSCDGIKPLREIMAAAPILVEGKVISLNGWRATLRVDKVLRGSVSPGPTITVEDSWCYQSLYVGVMELQQSYVLPLSAARFAFLTNEPSPPGTYVMLPCAESGLLLADGKLFTFEQSIGAERRLRFYGMYSNFLQWRPLRETAAVFGMFLASPLRIAAMQGEHALQLMLLGIGLVSIVSIVAFVRLTPELKRKSLPLLIALPVLWIAIGIWSAAFRYTGYPFVATTLQEISWQSYPPLLALILLLAVAAIQLRRVPRAWPFAVPYSLLNAYFATTMCMVGEIVINAI